MLQLLHWVRANTDSGCTDLVLCNLLLSLQRSLPNLLQQNFPPHIYLNTHFP